MKEEEVQTGGKFLGHCLGMGAQFVNLIHYREKTDIGQLPALEEKKIWLIAIMFFSYKFAMCLSALSLKFSVSSVL